MGLKTGSEKTAEDLAGIVKNANKNNQSIENPGTLSRRTMYLPDNHWETLSGIAKEEGVKTSQLIRKAIKDFIERY